LISRKPLWHLSCTYLIQITQANSARLAAPSGARTEAFVTVMYDAKLDG
jgi:hypothetical protein